MNWFQKLILTEFFISYDVAKLIVGVSFGMDFRCGLFHFESYNEHFIALELSFYKRSITFQIRWQWE